MHIILVSLAKSLYRMQNESSGENMDWVRIWLMWTFTTEDGWFLFFFFFNRTDIIAYLVSSD